MPTERINSLDTATISRILGAAVGEFADRPYTEASFNGVIRAAGISKGMMYYYFESKEDLFTALLHSAVRRFLTRVGPLPQVADAAAFWLETERLLAAFLDFMAEEADLARFLRRIFGSAAAAASSPARLTVKGLSQWLQGLMDIGRRVGAIRGDRSLDWLVTIAWANWDVVAQRLVNGEVEAAEARSIVLDLWRRILEV